MKKLTTFAIGMSMMMLLTTSAFAPPQPGQPSQEDGGQDPLALLDESHGLMRELALEDLPLGRVGGKTQNKQERIISNLDTLIQIILDANAEEVGGEDEEKEKEKGGKGKKGQSDPQNSGKSSSKPSGKPGGEEPAAMAGGKAGGNPKGNEYGDVNEESEGKKADEWGLLPGREFKESRMSGKTVVPKGYDELLELFRRVIAREGARLPK